MPAPSGYFNPDPVVAPPEGASQYTNPDPIFVPKQPSFMEEMGGYGAAAGNWVGNKLAGVGRGAAAAGRAVAGAVRGEQDPAYAHITKTIFDEPNLRVLPTLGAAMVSPDDEMLANIMKKQLGNRFLSMTKDKNDYPIIEYVNAEGKAEKVYINKPGGDIDDVFRVVAQAIPYTIGGGLAGTSGGGVIKQGIKQAATAAAVSAGSDTVANMMGSEQGVDMTRLMWAAGGAFGGELANRAVGKVAEIFARHKLFKGGKLTPEGMQEATKYGIDPAALEEQGLGGQFAREITGAEDPMAAARKNALQARGLNPTLGQVSRINEDMIFEEDILKGVLDTPSNRYSSQLQTQYDDVKKNQVPMARDKMAEDLTGTPPPSKRQLGEDISKNIKDQFDAASAQEGRNWDKVPPIKADQAARKLLESKIATLKTKSPRVYERIRTLDPKLHPHAVALREEMEKFVEGKLVTEKSMYGAPKGIDVDTMRRRILDYRRNAFGSTKGGSDYAGVKLQKEIFDDYIDDLALTKTGADAAKLKYAVDYSKIIRSKFGTTGEAAKDPAGKFVKNLVDTDNVTPEVLVEAMFNKTNGKVVSAKIKGLLGDQSDEWKKLKAYAIERQFLDAKGGDLPIAKGTKNLQHALTENSQYRELFDANDIATMKRFIKDMDYLNSPKTIRAKGSAWAQTISKSRQHGLIRYVLRRKGQAATFQSKPTQSFALQFASRLPYATPVASIKEMSARRVMKKIQDARIRMKKSRVAPPAVSGIIGGMTGGASEINWDRE